MEMNNKIFKTIQEQIDLLKSRGVVINNQKNLEYYLKWYNYQNFINGYNDPFLINFQRKNNKYNEGITEASIAELFNFDRSIGPLLLSNIQNIERRFSSSMAYEIAKELKNNSIDCGLIFKKNINTHIKIFKSKSIWKELKKNLIGSFEKSSSDLQIKYKSNSSKNEWLVDVPIWTLSIYWSFGDAIEIFKSLNKNIKKSIISSVFEIEFINTDEFIKIISMLKKIRNRICHNNVLYNIEIKDNENIFIEFLKRHIEYIPNKIRICDIVKIIDIVLGSSKNKLWTVFTKKIISKIENSGNIPVRSKEFILKKMNFIQF